MSSFIILISIVTILGIMYINRLIKYKFSDEKRPIWRIIHIITFIIGFIPFLGIWYLVLIDADIKEIVILIIVIFLYLIYKNYKNYKK